MVSLGKEDGALVLWEPKGEAPALPYSETASWRSDTGHPTEHRGFRVEKDKNTPGREKTLKHKEQRAVTELDALSGLH